MSVADAMELAARIADPDDGSVEEMMDLGADVCGVLRAEVKHLRAVIEGRTTPPTREECDALVAGGGWWRCDTLDGSWDVTVCTLYSDLNALLRDAGREGVTLRWWAHDRTGRPCAWPTVTP